MSCPAKGRLRCELPDSQPRASHALAAWHPAKSSYGIQKGDVGVLGRGKGKKEPFLTINY